MGGAALGPPKSGLPQAASAGRKRAGAGFFPVCANSGCSSGWLRLWRARQTPVFEGGWLCGPQCTRTLVRAAVAREMQGHQEPIAAHRHRVPLGLVLVSQGAITPGQLKAALARQKVSGGRLGMWLRRDHGVEERVITRALGAQWGCPVLSLDNHSPERVAALAPRLFLDAFGVLPLRRAGALLLYLGYEDRIDRCVNFAIERMTGLRVEAGLVDGGEFARAHACMLGAAFPPARLIEAGNADAMAATFTRILEETKPAESRLVRMHDYYWLRMWKRREGAADPAAARIGWRLDAVEDVLGSLAGQPA
jgi:hypothetical protein